MGDVPPRPAPDSPRGGAPPTDTPPLPTIAPPVEPVPLAPTSAPPWPDVPASLNLPPRPPSPRSPRPPQASDPATNPPTSPKPRHHLAARVMKPQPSGHYVEIPLKSFLAPMRKYASIGRCKPLRRVWTLAG